MLRIIMRILSWTLVAAWMIVIFILSSQPVDKSSSLSKGITEFIVGTAVTKDTAHFDKLNHLVRKNAHLLNYLILGVLLMNAMRSSGMSRYKILAMAFILCALFAVSDELHQLFVPGRGASGNDVLIDCVGALIGIGIYGFVYGFVRRTLVS